MRRVLVTGGAKRVGAVIARTLRANGHQPVIHYNSSADEAEALAHDLGTVAIGANLSDLAAAEGLIARATEKAGGPLHGLVNNASIFDHDRPASATAEELLRQYTVNTAAPVLLSKAFAAQARAGEDGVIVNLLDQKLWSPHADHFSYTLSKSALAEATMLMAKDFAPRVRVLGVAPGYNLPSPGESDEQFLAKADRVNALERRLTPEDVAEVVALCFGARCLTGQVLYADNGEHLIPSARDVVFQNEDG